jgi:hypothetical protein
MAIDRRCRFTERNRGDRGRSVGTNAGELLQLGRGLGKSSHELARNDVRALVQVARPRVVAKPRPRCQNVVELGVSKRRDRRPAR